MQTEEGLNIKCHVCPKAPNVELQRAADTEPLGLVLDGGCPQGRTNRMTERRLLDISSTTEVVLHDLKQSNQSIAAVSLTLHYPASLSEFF